MAFIFNLQFWKCHSVTSLSQRPVYDMWLNTILWTIFSKFNFCVYNAMGYNAMFVVALVTWQGSKLYAQSHSSTLFQLFVGTRNKPMYGAGTNMQDMLESENGLPIVIRVSLRSNFRVVWNLIKPAFHHRAVCLLVLDGAYDKKHRTQVYNSTCTMSWWSCLLLQCSKFFMCWKMRELKIREI